MKKDTLGPILTLSMILYAIFGTAVVSLMGYFYPHTSSVFVWPLLLIAATAPSIYYFIVSRNRFDLKTWLVENIDFFIVTLLVFIIRLHFSDKIGLWLDEEGQLSSVLIQHPLGAGAYQHQPPLDMIFMKLGVFYFGVSELGARFHAILFSALSSGLLFSLFRKITKSYLVSFALVLLYSTHTIVVQFGYESRPISLGLFCSVLFIYMVYTILTEKENSFYFEFPTVILALTFLFLSSVGFQPPFILLSTLICLLPRFKSSKTIHHFYRYSLSALGLFLPIQLFIFKNAPYIFKELKSIELGRFDRFIFYFKNDFSEYWNPLLFSLALLLALILIISTFKKLKISSELTFFALMTFTFFALVIGYFLTFIDYGLNTRYLICGLPIILVGLALAVKFFAELIPNGKGAIAWLICGIICIKAAGLPHFVTSFDEYAKRLNREDFRGAYLLTQRDYPASRPTVLPFCAASIRWCPAVPVGAFLYHTSNTERGDLDYISKIYAWDNMSYYEAELQKTEHSDFIYYIYIGSWSDLKLEIPEIIAELPGKIYVIKIDRKNRPLVDVTIEFMDRILQIGLKDNKLFLEPLAYLVKSYQSKNQPEKYKPLLKLYASRQNKGVNYPYLELKLPY